MKNKGCPLISSCILLLSALLALTACQPTTPVPTPPPAATPTIVPATPTVGVSTTTPETTTTPTTTPVPPVPTPVTPTPTSALSKPTSAPPTAASTPTPTLTLIPTATAPPTPTPPATLAPTPAPIPTPTPTRTPTPTFRPTPTPTPVPATVVLLFLNPAQLALRPGQTFVINVEARPGKYGLSAGEVNLVFNPAVMSIADIQPGDLLGLNPIVGTKQVDNGAGKLKYALARVGPTASPTSSGVFAIITFRVLPSAQTGKHALAISSVGLANESLQSIASIMTEHATLEVTE